MKNLKKFEELEWGRFYNHDTYEFLEEVFVEFLEPGDRNFKPARSNRVEMGTNMMVTYELIIPLPDGFTLEKMQIILDKLQGCLDKTKSELPDIRSNIKAIDGHIKLVIWNK